MKAMKDDIKTRPTPTRDVVEVCSRSFLWSFPTQIVIAAFSRRLFGCLDLLQVSSRSVVGKYRHEIPTEYSVAVFSRRFCLSCILLKTVSMLLVGKRTQKNPTGEVIDALSRIFIYGGDGGIRSIKEIVKTLLK